MIVLGSRWRLLCKGWVNLGEVNNGSSSRCKHGHVCMVDMIVLNSRYLQVK